VAIPIGQHSADFRPPDGHTMETGNLKSEVLEAQRTNKR